MMRNYVFDCETGPMGSDALELIMPAFNEEDVKLGALKDPVKITEKIEKARRDHAAKFMRNAALNALSGEILAIGFRGPVQPADLLIGQPERILIQAFFSFFEESFDRGPAHWIGFNIANFDIPFLVRRAWHHKITVPERLLVRRLPSCFTDLMLVWQVCHYPPELVSLNALAQFFGLPAKENNGAQFAELLRYEPETARQYLANDLELTWSIAGRLGVMRTRGEPFTTAPIESAPEPEIIQFF